jgi:hypothetical protein
LEKGCRKSSEKVKVGVAGEEEAATDAEENRQEVLLGEKLCELECSELCGGGTEGDGSDEDLQHQGIGVGDMVAEMELGEMMMLWVEEKTFF